MTIPPRRIDLDAVLRAHAFLRVERPPEIWEVDVDDDVLGLDHRVHPSSAPTGGSAFLAGSLRLLGPVTRSMGAMAVTSTMLALGTEAPDFALADVVSGRTVTLHDFDDADALLVMFLCRHCPYVAHVRAGVAELARDRDPRLAIVAISANDPEAYPEDAPVGLAAEAVEAGYTFPYLFDETQEVAKGYTAACTPDFFLFDRDRRLAYRGQFDDSRPRNDVPVTGKDLRAAIDAVLSGERPSADQRPSVGCGIKWRPGNEPSFG